jgi:hypothetical protein
MIYQWRYVTTIISANSVHLRTSMDCPLVLGFGIINFIQTSHL